MTNQGQIYRHVVFFKFHDDAKREKLEAIVAAFRALCDSLPFVRGFEWGQNSSPEDLNEAFTHCFIVTFGSANDRDLYLPHPSHQAFCRDYLDPNLEKVCVIDFVSNR
jgi:hypothetical protein